MIEHGHSRWLSVRVRVRVRDSRYGLVTHERGHRGNREQNGEEKYQSLHMKNLTRLDKSVFTVH